MRRLYRKILVDAGIQKKEQGEMLPVKKPDNLAASDGDNEENTYAEKSKKKKQVI